MARCLRGWILFSGALLLFGWGPAWAEDDPKAAPTPEPKREDAVHRAEEVTVTAQKREERAVDVPIAITTLDSVQIDATGLRKIDDAAKYTPNLHFETVGLSRPQTSIRGIGTGAFDAGSDPSVPVYVDEVYIPRFGGMTFDLFDLERIEILKGPQGTLFGRNAAGGAISVVTRKPEPGTKGRLEIGGGDFSAFNGAGTLNGTLSPDKVFGRVTVAYKRRDGYSLNQTTNTKDNNEDSFGARGTLLVHAGQKVTLVLAGEYGRDRLAMWANENVTPAIWLLFPPLASKYHATPDKYSEPYTRDGHQNRDLWGASARLDWSTPAGVLTSLTSFRRNNFDEYQDLDATLADVLDRRAIEENKAFSQELRFANSKPRFSWLAGLYFFHENTDRTDDLVNGPDGTLARVFNRASAFTDTWVDTFKTDSYAAFGQATVGLGGKVNATLGGRYSYDRKSADRGTDNHGVSSPLLPVNYTAQPEHNWSSFDPVVTLQYRFGPDGQAYASYREGFKSGGFQYAVASARAASTTFNPEHVKTWEVGAKYLSPQRRVALDTALFWNDYQDMQFFAATGTQGGLAPLIIVTNAGQSTAKGFEVQLVTRPSTGLELSLGYGLADATFDRYVDGNGKSQAGHDLIRTPRNSASAAAQYSVTLSGVGVLIARGEWVYKDRMYFDPDNIIGQPSYNLFNARLSLSTSKGGWEFAAWGKNLGDKLYYQNIISVAASTVGLGTVALPRTLGVTIAKNF